MSIKSVLISFLILVGVAGIIWFGIQPVSLFFKLYSPLSDSWRAVHLTNGDVFYGHFNGNVSGILRLADVYYLDVYNKTNAAANPSANIYDDSASKNFSLGSNIAPTAQKYILWKKGKEIYINRTNISYWEEVSPEDEVAQYLK